MSLFDGSGPLTPEEWELLWKEFKIYGRHDWNTTIKLGDNVPPRVEKMFNDLTKRLGNFAERLLLTAAEAKGVLKDMRYGPSKAHAGDCSIYAAMANGKPTDGICNCGYGLRRLREGDDTQMYSQEMQQRLSIARSGR